MAGHGIRIAKAAFDVRLVHSLYTHRLNPRLQRCLWHPLWCSNTICCCANADPPTKQTMLNPRRTFAAILMFVSHHLENTSLQICRRGLFARGAGFC